jgi:hypothetical protein
MSTKKRGGDKAYQSIYRWVFLENLVKATYGCQENDGVHVIKVWNPCGSLRKRQLSQDLVDTA